MPAKLLALVTVVGLLPVAPARAEPWPPPVYGCYIDDTTGVWVGWAEAPGAIDLALACHFSSATRRVQVGAASYGAGAHGAGRVDGWIGPSQACAELHVTYLDGGRHWTCP